MRQLSYIYKQFSQILASNNITYFPSDSLNTGEVERVLSFHYINSRKLFCFYLLTDFYSGAQGTINSISPPLIFPHNNDLCG